MRRSVLVAALTAIATAAATLLVAWLTGLPSAAHKDTGATRLGDPDYGVCRGTDARCYHDWGNFDPGRGDRVLLHTRTAGPRDADHGPPLGPDLYPPLTPANGLE